MNGQYEELKAAIEAVIKENGQQEITGNILQQVLTGIVTALGKGATYGGIATPETEPTDTDANKFYFAFEHGTYTNFGGVVMGTNTALATIQMVSGNWVLTEVISIEAFRTTLLEAFADILTGKQDVINDLAEIRSGASDGAEALTALANYSTTSAMNEAITNAITIAIANYYTKSEIDADHYTKTHADELLSGKQNVIDDLAEIRTGASAGTSALAALANYSTSAQMISAIASAIATALTDYYTKTQSDERYYTKTQANELLNEKQDTIPANTYDAYGTAEQAKDEVIGNAGVNYNTLGKIEQRIQEETTARENADNALDSRVDSLEITVGSGGAIDTRIENAKTEIIGGASTDYNTLLKLENKIKAEAERAENTEAGIITTAYEHISQSINALDAVKEQTAGADGLALSVTQEDGKITEVSGSIAPNTYDAHGAAATVKSELLGDAATDYNTLGKVEDKIQAEATTRGEADAALDTRVDALETAVGTGGTVDQRIASAVSEISDDITEINGKIPSAASSANKLVDEASLQAEIIANLPNSKGQFTTLTQLQAVANPKDGDLGIVRTTDSDGHPLFTFYQYKDDAWGEYYALAHHLQDKPATTGLTGAYPNNGMARIELPKNPLQYFTSDTFGVVQVNGVVYLLYSYNFQLYAVYNSETQKGLGIENVVIAEPSGYNISDIADLVGNRYLSYTEDNGVYTITKPDETTITSTTLNNTAKWRYNEDTQTHNVLTQSMINQPNTIYVIQYDFDLNAATITIPSNCVLEFEGGSINNGTIVGNNTYVSNPSDIKNIFGATLIKSGTWKPSLDSRIEDLEEAVGEGGSVDERIATAIQEEVTNRNTAISDAVAVETNRAEAAELLLQQQYNALSQTGVEAMSAAEWETLSADTSNLEEQVIYRVAGTSSYTDYMWNGTSIIPMATYNNAIDDVPTAGSNNLVKSGGVKSELDNVEYLINDKQTILANQAGWSDYAPCYMKAYTEYIITNIGSRVILSIAFRSGTTKSANEAQNIAVGESVRVTPWFDTDNYSAYGNGAPAKFTIQLAENRFEKLSDKIEEEEQRAEASFNDLQLDDSTTQEDEATKITVSLNKNDGTQQDPDIRELDAITIVQASETKAGLLPAKNTWDSQPTMNSKNIVSSKAVFNSLNDVHEVNITEQDASGYSNWISLVLEPNVEYVFTNIGPNVCNSINIQDSDTNSIYINVIEGSSSNIQVGGNFKFTIGRASARIRTRYSALGNGNMCIIRKAADKFKEINTKIVNLQTHDSELDNILNNNLINERKEVIASGWTTFNIPLYKGLEYTITKLQGSGSIIALESTGATITGFETLEEIGDTCTIQVSVDVQSFRLYGHNGESYVEFKNNINTSFIVNTINRLDNKDNDLQEEILSVKGLVSQHAEYSGTAWSQYFPCKFYAGYTYKVTYTGGTQIIAFESRNANGTLVSYTGRDFGNNPLLAGESANLVFSQDVADFRAYFQGGGTLAIELVDFDIASTAIDNKVKVEMAESYSSKDSIKHTLIVAKDGVAGHYASIAEAYAAITDGSYTNQYEVVVYPGKYSELNLIVPTYTHTRAMFPNSVVVSSEGVDESSSYPVFDQRSGSSKLSDITIISYNGYCIHYDYQLSNQIIVNENLTLIKAGRNTGATNWSIIGGGTFYNGTKYIWKNCVFNCTANTSVASADCHTNGNQVNGNTHLVFDGCMFINCSPKIGSVGGSGNYVCEVKNCVFPVGDKGLGNWFSPIRNIDDPTLYRFEKNEWQIIGGGNKNLSMWQLQSGKTIQLRAGYPIAISGTAANIIFGYNPTFNNVKTARLDCSLTSEYYIDDSQAGYPPHSEAKDVYQLWKRLGDCSTTNKTLTVTVNNVSKTYTFTENYLSTKTAQATIIAAMQAVLDNVTIEAITSSGYGYNNVNTTDIIMVKVTSPDILKGELITNSGAKATSSTVLKDIAGVACENKPVNEYVKVWTSAFRFDTDYADGEYGLDANGALDANAEIKIGFIKGYNFYLY